MRKSDLHGSQSNESIRCHRHKRFGFSTAGQTYRFGSGFGFDGVAIALIAQLNPIGALIVALLFGILSTGGTMMQSVIGVPTAIVDIIRGMIIIFAVAGMAMVKLPKVKAFLSSLGSKNKKAEVTA